jgi:hypothetical protein
VACQAKDDARDTQDARDALADELGMSSTWVLLLHRCSQPSQRWKKWSRTFPAADRTAPRGIEFDEDTLRCRFCLAESYNFPATLKLNINKYLWYFNIKHPETYIVKQIRKNDATEEPDFSHTHTETFSQFKSGTSQFFSWGYYGKETTWNNHERAAHFTIVTRKNQLQELCVRSTWVNISTVFLRVALNS